MRHLLPFLPVLLLLCSFILPKQVGVTADASPDDSIPKGTSSHHILTNLLSAAECGNLWATVRQDVVNIRVDPSSPFSDKYHNVSSSYADHLLDSLGFLVQQAHFNPSGDEIIEHLDIILPIGLLARISSQSSADSQLRQLISPSAAARAMAAAADNLSADRSSPASVNAEDSCKQISADGGPLAAKALLLLSPYNTIQVPPECVFDALGNRVGSLWYMRYYDFHTVALAHLSGRLNLRAHQRLLPSARLKYVDNTISSAYFGSSYVDPEGSDSTLKMSINQVIQNAVVGNISIDAQHQVSDRKKDVIVVISQVWYREHSVYRTFAKQLASLRPHYTLVLVRCHTRLPITPGFFDEVVTVPSELDVLSRFQTAAHETVSRQPSIVFYPDIGMSTESVYLANHRLAPIQIASYGHSVSTFGAMIDYWIGSRSVELLSRARDHYTETLVLIDGVGVTHSLPPFTTLPGPRPALSIYDSDDHEYYHGIPPGGGRVVINCAWAPMKINTGALAVLREVAQSAKSHVTFVFYPGMHERQLMGHVLGMEVRAAIGDAADVVMHPLVNYDEYMGALAKGDLFLDSWPYGGCNTVMDALVLHKPVVTRRGTRWHNRVGASQLDVVGLTDLVAESKEEYVAKAVELIDSSSLRQQVAERVALARVLDEDKLGGSPVHFKTAFDMLLEKHHEWVGDEAVEEDEAVHTHTRTEERPTVVDLTEP